MNIISKMDINNKLAELEAKSAEELQRLMGTPVMMYGSELPFYFLYKADDGAEGVKHTHVRLLDLVLNRDDTTKPYMIGDVALPLDIEGFYAVIPNSEICIIQAELPDQEVQHAVALRSEIDKVYTILHETYEAGKEVTIKFHALETTSGNDHDAG